MLISEMKSVLAHLVPFLRNRKIIFHETVNYAAFMHMIIYSQLELQHNRRSLFGFCSDGRNVKGIKGM